MLVFKAVQPITKPCSSGGGGRVPTRQVPYKHFIITIPIMVYLFKHLLICA